MRSLWVKGRDDCPDLPGTFLAYVAIFTASTGPPSATAMVPLSRHRWLLPWWNPVLSQKERASCVYWAVENAAVVEADDIDRHWLAGIDAVCLSYIIQLTVPIFAWRFNPLTLYRCPNIDWVVVSTPTEPSLILPRRTDRRKAVVLDILHRLASVVGRSGYSRMPSEPSRMFSVLLRPIKPWRLWKV